MENFILETIKIINPAQLIILAIFMIFSYFKIKKQFQEVKNELEKQINGLGSRFDNQFGEYKDKNTEKLHEIEQRLSRLEGESSIIQLNKQIETKVDKLLTTICCK